MPRPIWQALIALTACGLVVAGIIAGGMYLRKQLRDDPSQQFPFREIDCPTPPETTRDAFLSEVQYLSESPDRVPLLDDELPLRLAGAFSQHPWVETVEKIEIGPGRTIRAKLKFRQPVLGVPIDDPMRPGDPHRAVDRGGVLLPFLAAMAEFPKLRPTPAGPLGRTGQPWGEASVEGAAAIAAILQPHQPELKLADIEFRGGMFQLRPAEGRGPVVIWGKAPGLEGPKEQSAEQKRQLLLKRWPTLVPKDQLDLR